MILNCNDRQFSKRVYTQLDQHTGESKAYMQSTIDLSFDGGNYFGIDKDIKEQDLRTIMDKSAKQGKFSSFKDYEKIHN